jgi:hypothetical protein
MIEIALPEVWKIAGALLALQLAAFWWRMKREMAVERRGDITWLPPADLLNLSAIVVSLFCVFVLPTVGVVSESFARISFGLVAILFAGFVLSLPAHYELYAGGHRTYRYFPLQEKLAVALVLLCAVVYVGFCVAR